MSYQPLTATIPQLQRLIPRVWKAGITPMITGSPGTGKSQMIQAVAKEYKLKLIDLRLAQCDPTDLSGFPVTNREEDKAGYLPMNTFPLDTDPIPAGYNGWCLLLDELTHADRSVQKAAYKLILDHQVGAFNLHPKCVKIGAGNLVTDNAHVEEMGTALQSRMVHFVTKIDNESWMQWATDSGIDTRVLAYLSYKPSALYNFDPQHTDQTYPCYRTWEFTSNLIKDYPQLDRDSLILLAGTIGQGTAVEFCKFTEIYQKLVTVAEILRNPEGIAIPNEPDQLFALSGSIADHMTEDNVEDLLKFVSRMGGEFQIIIMKLTVSRNREFLKIPSVMSWVTEISRRIKLA